MKLIRLALNIAIFGLLTGAAPAQLPRSQNRPKDVPPPPPAAFALRQNTPDPFCAGAIGGFTTIEFATPQSADIQLEVRSPDGNAVVRTLVNATLQAGYHTVIWDGRDVSAAPVPAGVYPYRMTARQPGIAAPLFETQLLATVSCPVPVDPTTWGRLKFLFFAGVR